MIEQLKKELERLAGQGRQRQFHIVNSRAPGVIELGGKRFVDFSNWDALNLHTHPKVRRTLQEEIERFGVATASNRLASGTFQPHISAENRIAKFVGTESALLFSSRTQALLSLVTALCSERDLICFDELCQAPVSDAAYLTNTPAQPFTVADLSSLEEPLAKAREGTRKFIFVEAFSPVSGRKVDLTALSELSRHHDAKVILDSSCSLGLSGARGAGVLEAAKVEDLPFVQLADLSTGLGGFGAFLASDRITISYLVQKSRNLRLESPLPPALASAIEVGLDHAELQTAQRACIQRHAERVRNALRTMKATVYDSSDCPFVCLQLSSLRTSFELQEFLLTRGMYAENVPRGTLFDQGAVLRLIFNSEHSERQIEDLVVALSESVPKTFSA